mmetsp:Transcript_13245/g.23323  ORF Transcript_13245/g.23323 Transcript_13245/m.23323 type:complete len:122 (-) Transcript_13245:225-590(-)
MVSIPLQFPRGPIGWVALIGMVMGVSVVYLPTARDLAPLKLVYGFGTMIFRSHAGLKLVMDFAMLAHVIETAIIAVICNRKRVPFTQTLGWMVQTLFVGYPSIAAFQHAARKQGKAGRKAL